MSTSKICSRCKGDKDLSEFQKDKTRPDGYMYHCKLCRLKFERVRRGKDPEGPYYRRPNGDPFNRKKYREEKRAYYTANQ